MITQIISLERSSLFAAPISCENIHCRHRKLITLLIISVTREIVHDVTRTYKNNENLSVFAEESYNKTLRSTFWSRGVLGRRGDATWVVRAFCLVWRRCKAFKSVRPSLRCSYVFRESNTAITGNDGSAVELYLSVIHGVLIRSFLDRKH